MTTVPPDPHLRLTAEKWFLDRGLPAVLRPGRLPRRLLVRSAPALAGFAVMMAASVLVVVLTGKHTIDIGGEPTRAEWFVLAVVVLVLPLAAATGWWVSRLDRRGRTGAATVSAVVAVLGGIFGGPSPYLLPDLLLVAVGIGLVVACTATGVGSVLGWATRVTLSNLALTGGLFVRSLPVVLLTVLVFFNTYVWLMAAIVGRGRLTLGLAFLGLLAVAFMVSSALDRARPMLASRRDNPEDTARLAGTPFAGMGDRRVNPPLSRAERINVVFVLAASQVAQVLTVAVVTMLIFFVLGLILVSPRLLAEWTRNTGTPDGTILGMTFPVPQALIHTSMFLGAMTFMYIAARTVGDEEYRSRFQDPQLDDLRLTLVARNRYRTFTAGSGR